MYKGFIFCVLLSTVSIVISSDSFATEQALSPAVTKKTENSTSSGESIYNKTCIACHGANGKGIAPSFPDFTQKNGVLSQPHNVLLHNVIHGIGSMPPKGGYPSLTDKDAEASLNYIMSHFASESTLGTGVNQAQNLQQMQQQIVSLNEKIDKLAAAQLQEQGETSQPLTNNKKLVNTNSQSATPKSKKAASINEGKNIYTQNCTRCHGANGKGVAPSFPDFTKKGGVLSQPTNVLFHNIKHGIGSMPAKGGNPSLSDDQLNAALNYIENKFSRGQKNKLSQTSVLIRKQNGNSQKVESASETTKFKDQNVQTNLTGPSYFWPSPDISGLLTGGASAGYSTQKHPHGSFDILDFNPLFLFRYKDLLLMQSSVDFSLDDDANTQVSLDTLNLNLYINNYMILGIGEYDSPLGYFVQNLSPSWVNRLPNAPVGFDSDQAAPQSLLGTQLRGGFSFLSASKVNYIVFVANGPRAFADTNTGLIDYIGTDPFPKNYGNFVTGGRIGVLPIPDLEIGLSAAGGKLALFDVNTNLTLFEPGRNYKTLGADLSFKWKNWDFRAEVIKQQLSAWGESSFPQNASWKAWYLQAAYLFPALKLQPVVRWGGFTSADSSQSQHQVALGLDYWIAPSIAVQVAYEINHWQVSANNSNRLFLAQLVFGF